jgi:hypothetical protein
LDQEIATLTSQLTSWGVIIGMVFSVVVTISSIVLKMVTNYFKSIREIIPDYAPSKAMIIFVSVLQGLSQNSPSAATIFEKRPD